MGRRLSSSSNWRWPGSGWSGRKRFDAAPRPGSSARPLARRPRLGLVPRSADPRGDHGEAIVPSQLLIRRIQVGFVATGDASTPLFKLSGTTTNGTPSMKASARDVAANPMLQFLADLGFSIGVNWLAPNTATKICAWVISPVWESTRGTVSPA